MLFWTWNIQTGSLIKKKQKKPACLGAKRSRRNNADALISSYGQEEQQGRNLRLRQHLLLILVSSELQRPHGADLDRERVEGQPGTITGTPELQRSLKETEKKC